MPTTSITLPDGQDVTLTYAETRPLFPKFGPLQSLRSNRMPPDGFAATQYHKMAPFYAAQFATHIDPSWGAVVCPPSSNDLAKPYLEAIIERTHATNLSHRFKRTGEVRSSSDPPPTLADLIASESYETGDDESGMTSLLFIDDIFASGRTFAALLHHLRKCGLSSECALGAAAPLWLPSRLSS